MDRHKIWRVVANNLRSLESAAPEGYNAIADVFLVGRAEPVRMAYVETERDTAFSLVFLQPALEDEDGTTDQTNSPDARVILVPEQFIERIELSYVRSKTRGDLGFSYEVVDTLGEPNSSG